MGDTLPNTTREESAWVYGELGRAKQEVENHGSISLTDSEKGVLQGLIEGKQHKDISAELHLTLDYARETASKLYQYVKKWTGVEKVDKNTIRSIIEEQLKLRNIPKPSPFYGREDELRTLTELIIGSRASLIVLYGMAKIGKTSLAARLVAQQLVYQRFERVIWLSLKECSSLKQLIVNLKAHLPESLTANFLGDGDPSFSLISLLTHHPYCLVLDGIEEDLIRDPARWPSYTQFFTSLGRASLSGRSCVIATSQLKLVELKPFETNTAAIHSRKIYGLEPKAGRELLHNRDLKDESYWNNLIDACSGNPWYLDMIASTIHEHFGGRVAQFCSHETTYLAGYETILSSIFEFLDPIDKHILTVLANADTPKPVNDLIDCVYADLANQAVKKSHIFASLTRLNDRSLVESRTCTNGRIYTLNRLIRKYVDSYIS